MKFVSTGIFCMISIIWKIFNGLWNMLALIFSLATRLVSGLFSQKFNFFELILRRPFHDFFYISQNFSLKGLLTFETSNDPPNKQQEPLKPNTPISKKIKYDSNLHRIQILAINEERRVLTIRKINHSVQELNWKKVVSVKYCLHMVLYSESIISFPIVASTKKTFFSIIYKIFISLNFLHYIYFNKIVLLETIFYCNRFRYEIFKMKFSTLKCFRDENSSALPT